MSDRSAEPDQGVPGKVRIRSMVAEDLVTVEMLERTLFNSDAWSAASLAEELSGPGRTYVVAQLDQRVVGYAGLWFDGVDAQVMTVGTAAAVQGQGIGRQLVRTLLDRARALGAGQVFLEVRVDNDPAVHLYRSEGFELMGRRPRYYQPEGVDAWTMRLELSGKGNR